MKNLKKPSTRKPFIKRAKKEKKPLKKWHTNKKLTAVLSAVILVLIVSICIEANYKTPEQKAEIETKTQCINIAKSEINKYIADVQCESDPDLWLIMPPDSDGVTSINTYVTVPDKKTKQSATVMVTSSGEGQYTAHYVTVGGKVYMDDGVIQ